MFTVRFDMYDVVGGFKFYVELEVKVVKYKRPVTFWQTQARVLARAMNRQLWWCKYNNRVRKVVIPAYGITAKVA